MIIELKSYNFFKEQLLKKDKVVLKFYSNSCIPCKRLDSALIDIDTDKYLIYSVNVESTEMENLVSDIRVESLPTMVFIRRGEIVEKISGADISRIKRTVDEFFK